ncbi:MAG: SUMF1/EgtB/PvdO family nonheme iron enzyme, partial [Plesiomonas shigelloides]
ACADGSIRADANATAPTGYDTSNSRKIGGYHYGRIRNTLTVTDVATEIVPRSLWDLTYRPKCNPAGMVDVHGNGSLWADIYLAAVDSAITLTSGVVTAGTCKSIYNGTPLSGTEGLHGYNFIELAKNSGKRLLTHSEWLAVAHGSPQGNDGDNLNAWSATTNSARTGTGQVARAVSFCGATDCVGNLWEWLDEWSNDYSTAVAANWYNPMTGQNVGQQYLYNSTGLRMYLAGGNWPAGVLAGSRALNVAVYPRYVGTDIGSRFACDGI